MKNRTVIFTFFALNLYLLFGQTIKQTSDFAVISFVKKQQIFLRWAPGKFDLWKNANQYGYKVERFTGSDTSGQKLQLTDVALKPWPQSDARWNTLIQKNKSAAILFNLLFKQTASASVAGKEMAFGMALKSCDMYAEIAEAAGLFIEDNFFTAGEKYVYRVSLWNAPKTLKYTAALVTVNSNELSTLAKLKPIRAKFGNKKAVIRIITADTESDYSAFWIERSTDSVNFSVVNRSPLIHSSTKFDEGKTESLYRDTLPENDKRYYYRVRGISYFGDLSEPSNVVSGKGKPDFTTYPFIDSTLVIKNKLVKIKFRMPGNFDTKELKGFFICRCETKDGKYANITPNLLPASGTDFLDDKPKISNYYKVGAINNYGDSSISLKTFAKLIDDVPPEEPCNVKGSIDSSGAVSLTWDSNTEKDLMGYRVYRCNSQKEQPVELTTRILTTEKYSDKITLQSLTKEIYYTIRAVDKNYNNSAYSYPCKIVKPDKIAPVAPLFKQAVHTDSSIIIGWQLSTSADAAQYKLLKVDQTANGWQTVKEWKAKDSVRSYIDTAIRIEGQYRYRLEVYDEAKNNSFVNSPAILFQPAFAPAITAVKAEPNTEKRNIELNWNYTKAKVYTYTIYKAKGDDALRLFKTIGGDQTSFTDTELYPNNMYRYTIKATLLNGIESKKSRVIVVNY